MAEDDGVHADEVRAWPEELGVPAEFMRGTEFLCSYPWFCPSCEAFVKAFTSHVCPDLKTGNLDG